ncbi:recombinase family protein [Shimia sp. R9_1]|uniref:recombinase family protein n=1 Tax=Shimia sp. R9_1 TaxID=2821111 RepID=UPI001ADD3AC7|nr:recombinase family protein [Shimia sp. R9_1]MBO9407185.1 recombinase family protein [Shimia sp. R9_1]
MLIGYARTSTLEQIASLATQRESLKAIGCERVYEEQISSVAVREALSDAMSFCREGDTLVVTKLDRLARSVKHLGDIIEELEAKKVGLKILNMSLDTSHATGKLMLNVLASVAQFERELMLERQREGIAKAKAEGKYRGRPSKLAKHQHKVQALLEAGQTKQQIAAALQISERSVYRICSRILDARRTDTAKQNLSPQVDI